jgi:hypothetical protein
MVASLKITFFWDVVAWTLVKTDRRFKGVYCLHYQGEIVKAMSTSETSVNICETTRRNIPEDGHVLFIEVFDNGLYLFKQL